MIPPKKQSANHLNDLAALTEHILRRALLADDTPPDDVLLVVTTAAPAHASVCARNAVVLGAVDIATLAPTLVQALGAFIESGLAQLDEPTRRDTFAAMQAGGEITVTFRPLTGAAKLLLLADGHAPIELVTLRAVPVTH
jgi:hypothetical protein